MSDSSPIYPRKPERGGGGAIDLIERLYLRPEHVAVIDRRYDVSGGLDEAGLGVLGAFWD